MACGNSGWRPWATTRPTWPWHTTGGWSGRPPHRTRRPLPPWCCLGRLWVFCPTTTPRVLWPRAACGPYHQRCCATPANFRPLPGNHPGPCAWPRRFGTRWWWRTAPPPAFPRSLQLEVLFGHHLLVDLVLGLDLLGEFGGAVAHDQGAGGLDALAHARVLQSLGGGGVHLVHHLFWQAFGAQQAVIGHAVHR